jgi:hypothetical protein
MRYSYIFLISIVTTLALSAQNRYSFNRVINTEVYHGADSLTNAWAGGLNYPTFGNLDINLDGQIDLLAFDRAGKRILPMIRATVNGEDVYRYEPKYIAAFPAEIATARYILVEDFNCDSKQDLFLGDGSILVFENTGSNGELSFAPANNGAPLETDYLGAGRAVYANLGSDLPVIDDVDGDGDIDILGFEANGFKVQYHENFAPCGFNLKQTDDCWGDFAEFGITRAVDLDYCSNGGKKESYKTMHAGSAMAVLDLNADNVKDLLLTSVSFANLSALLNGGTNDTANLVSQDTLYPPSAPVDEYEFPAPYLADATMDGKDDLLISSFNNVISGSINNSNTHAGILRYENTGAANQPNFTLQEKDFLQGKMIDPGTAATPRLVDVDGDSLTDLIVAIASRYYSRGNFQSQFYYYRNTGTSTQPQFTLQDTNFANMLGYPFDRELVPAFGDLDADGDLDMIVGTISGYFHEFENTGTRSNPVYVQKTLTLTNTDVGANASPYLFDLDEDGDLDLFVGCQLGTIYYFENVGTPAQANFSFISDYFGAVNVRTPSGGEAKPALIRDSLGATLFVGSNERGVVQFDDIDTLAQLPPNLNAILGNQAQSSSNSNETLFGINKRSGRNQMLIRASELAQQGLTAGFIDALSFFVTDRGERQISNGVTIKLKNVNTNSLSSFVSNFPSPSAVQSKFISVNNGWNRIQFTNSFYWDGSSNLAIEVCFRGNIPGQNIELALTDAGFPSHAWGNITGFNTITANGCAMPFGANTQLRPDVIVELTPSANQLNTNENPRLSDGYRNSPDFADLNGDEFLDAVVGNTSGGLALYFGRQYDVGLDDFAKTEQSPLNIYPNPTREIFTVEQDLTKEDALHTLQLFNSQGALILMQPLQQAKEKINVAHLPKGIYLAVGTGPKTHKTAKVFISH